MQALTGLNILAVSAGAALGACLRWVLAMSLNGEGVWPIGTLIANLAGGYLIGLLLGMIGAHPEWPLWIRLALVTGFLGGLTTFSTFSAETIALLERGQYASALGYMAVSLAGSLALTALGLLTYRSLR